MRATPFDIRIEDERLEDLARRLANAKLAPDFGNDDWRYGVNGDYLRELVEYWIDGFDWRAQEAAMNAWDHYRVEIDDVPIHFLHARGKGPNPMPLVLTHGWPWTFWDFKDVIGPLTDPAAHGLDPAQSFDVVVPSLPGFAFSTPLTKTGLNWWTTADLWVRLMRDVLGYDRFAAHGGDWGTLVTSQLGHQYPEHLYGIHITGAFPLATFDGPRPWSISDAVAGFEDGSPEQQAAFAWEQRFASHIAVHTLGPQTLAHALMDSPVGLLAWILERRRSWGDCNGDVESRFSKDDLLTTIMLYWATESFPTSLRFYWETAWGERTPAHDRMPVIEAPTGITLFDHDAGPGSVDWTKDYYNLVLLERRRPGGHFAAAEEPEAIVEDIRRTFAGRG